MDKMGVFIILSGYLRDYYELATNYRDINDLLKKSICNSVERQLHYMWLHSDDITSQERNYYLRIFKKTIYRYKMF